MPKTKIDFITNGKSYEFRQAASIIYSISTSIDDLENQTAKAQDLLKTQVNIAQSMADNLKSLEAKRDDLYTDLNSGLDMAVIAIARLRERCPKPSERKDG